MNSEDVKEELYDWKVFWQELEKVSQNVDTWPEWKKQGWYILDGPQPEDKVEE